MADGGNVALENIADSVVYLRLQGACGSCPSSTTTMTLGIKRRLMEAFPVSGRGGEDAVEWEHSDAAIFT